MAWTRAHIPLVGALPRAWETFLALRPTFALAAVWLTTSGHTMNFREMDAARGWVSAEGYSLHSIYLGTIALTLLAAPNLVRRFGSYGLVVGGLVLLMIGAAINGCLLYAPAGIVELGRVLAGIGAGLVIREAPRIHAADWSSKVTWVGILLPPAGPLVIAGAVHAAGVTSWQGGFFFEGALALFALAVVLSIGNPIDPDPEVPRSLGYLPALAVSAGCLWYLMHWGQLHGWVESPDIVAAICVLTVGLSVAVWIVWPRMDWAALRENTPRLLLVVYGGFVQYFNASDMGVYGGLLVNFSPWMRAWLVISISIGAATGLALGRLFWWGRTPGYGGATLGLIVLATGMGISHNTTLNWPFWDVLNPVEFHWFPAPQHWQLAPPRFLMGFGSALVLLSMTTRTSRDPAREAKIRPYLEVSQFAGGALSIGTLVTVLLIAHPSHYSYTADQGFIQADEQFDREQRLTKALTQAGSRSPERQARSLLFQSVNYQADNLVFASIYGAFFVSSLALAACCFVGWMVEIGHSYRQWKWPAPSLEHRGA